MPQSRQLAAIMFTDIEGYSALMQHDEQKAIEYRDRHRHVVETDHQRHGGNVIEFYGDGSLSIFSSAVEAVNCALSMQKQFRQEPQIPIRIGLHMGDVVINEGHVFGDSVNVASRIESLGVPGSILISEKVNDELQNQPGFQSLSMGIYHLKNIEKEMEVFALDNDELVKPTPNTLTGKTEQAKDHRTLKKSIAVLPFVNMSNDPEQDYFSDGITEEILNSLAHLTDLKVAGRTSSFQFKGKNTDLREIGKQLDVHTILEGSVRKSANHLRITAQLINIEDGYHIWSERYDREMDDIFAIQDEIALSITEKLKITLLEDERGLMGKAPTENKQAYDLYLKGRFYWNRRGPGLKKGLEYFMQAAQIDPNFSQAYAGMSDTFALFAFYSVMPPQVAIPKAREAAERAIQLNPARIEPYSVLAYVTAFYDWNWTEAQHQFEKALAINPGYAPAHYWHSNYLCWIKRYDESIRQAKRAIELEPLISHSHNTLGNTLVCCGQYEEARRVSQYAIELDANSFISYCNLAGALHGLGKYKEAIEVLLPGVEVSGRHQYALIVLCWLYSLVGEKEKSQQLLDELLQRSQTEFISGLSIAVAAYYSGHHDMAFEFFEKAFEERASLLITMTGYPFLVFAREDERFQPFLKRMNYPA